MRALINGNEPVLGKPALKSKFKIEDSNYLVVMTDGREYVIESWQFTKLLPMLNDNKIEFVSINNSIENKKYIRRFTPTDRQTTEQVAKMELERAKKNRLADLLSNAEAAKLSFDAAHYDAKYGKGKWSKYQNGKKHRITYADLSECWKAFSKQYPEMAKLLETSDAN